MDHIPRAWPNARVGAHLCCNPDWQCVFVGGFRKLAAAANVYRYRLSFCRPAQLVRSSLFSDAPAGTLWPLAQLLHRGIRGNWTTHTGVCFFAGPLLREYLVGRELAQRDRHLEHTDDSVDRHARADARKTESEP